ncbi:MAG: CAP domain-containing protein, partial [Betaproteobacteria bacterium]|nr:CAP domain-containing protein [Betaproteobacteria bacterium]
MKNLVLPIALAAVMATLAACGGGGGDTTPAQTD